MVKTVVSVVVSFLCMAAVLAFFSGDASADAGKGGGEMYRIPAGGVGLSLTAAGTPTVNGRYTDDVANYDVLGTADSGRGTLFYNLSGNTLYLLMRVNYTVNDNVFGNTEKKDSTPDDTDYLNSVNWTKHKFKDLVKSDRISITVQCGANTWNWEQDYVYDAGDKDELPRNASGWEADWASDVNGPDGGGSPPPGLVSASSLQWNLNNSPWDLTIGGARTSNKTYKSPFDTGFPNTVPSSHPKFGGTGFDTTHQWEWWMAYEMSLDVSTCGNNDILVGVNSAHNSPSKDEDRDVPVTPTPLPKDFGDLPASYNNTTLADDGARHTVDGLFLGSTTDSETDGQESANASGDDSNGTDDEDGVVPIGIWSDSLGAVQVTVSGGTGCLTAWIDWNNDGDFLDSGELIISNQSASTGSQNFTFDPPDGTFTPGEHTFFSRFRLVPSNGGTCDSTTTVDVTGLVNNGEVEDYQFVFQVPTAITLASLSARSMPARSTGIPISGIVLLTAGMLGAFVVMQRRRN